MKELPVYKKLFDKIWRQIVREIKQSTVFVSTEKKKVLIRSVNGIKTIPFQEEAQSAVETFVKGLSGHKIIK